VVRLVSPGLPSQICQSDPHHSHHDAKVKKRLTVLKLPEHCTNIVLSGRNALSIM
jgi:hypothetical protein